MMKSPRFLHKMTSRYSDGSLRKLRVTAPLTDFISNDYLGLSLVPSQSESYTHSGTGSRLISGNSASAEQAENHISKLFGAERSLIFNSGYDANLGLFSSVPQKGEVVLYDELVHASVRDGVRLSFAESFSFKHNDVTDLAGKLQKYQDRAVFVAIESYYSMDGDLAPVEEILGVVADYGALLVVDEAHACGVFGMQGLGMTYAFRDHPSLFARVITFGKAYGAHGGAVLGSEKLIEFLINFSRSFIYTTAMPPDAYKRIEYMTRLSAEENKRREILFANIAAWNQHFEGNPGPIQVIPCTDKLKLTACVEQAEKLGWALKAVFSPTVPSGKERLRICIHSDHSEKELEELALFIKECIR